MKLSVTVPYIDVGGDPITVRDFAQTAEGLGYDGLGAPDHVLGVNVASRPFMVVVIVISGKSKFAGTNVAGPKMGRTVLGRLQAASTSTPQREPSDDPNRTALASAVSLPGDSPTRSP